MMLVTTAIIHAKRALVVHQAIAYHVNLLIFDFLTALLVNVTVVTK
jgi:hypothetical protein